MGSVTRGTPGQAGFLGIGNPRSLGQGLLGFESREQGDQRWASGDSRLSAGDFPRAEFAANFGLALTGSVTRGIVENTLEKCFQSTASCSRVILPCPCRS